MSYCRFIEADAYVFFNGQSLECCACNLVDEDMFSFCAFSTGGMIEHLWQHQNKGGYRPEDVFDNLWLDNEENFGGGGQVKKTFTAEEVDKIENQAYETGLAVGKYAEQKKLIDLIESMDTSSVTSSLGSLVWTKHLVDKINSI